MAPRLRGRPTGVTEEPDERQPPRLQDTSEREALPVPLPESESDKADDATVVWPSEDFASEGETAAEQPASVDEPAPEPPAAAAGNGSAGQDAGLPPFEPAPSVAGIADDAGEGLPAEVLVGAAFLGGIALAYLIKRLGS